MSLTQMMERLTDLPELITLLLCGLGAGLEYVFPPFPGDTVTLAAAVIASLSGSSWWQILLFATGGSVLGSAIAWYVGHWFVQSGRYKNMKPSQRKNIETILKAFEKHGPIWLTLNRFIPGLRAFFFVAAAMARIPLGVAILWSALSALLWSGLLVGLGVLLANNLDALERAVRQVQYASLLFVAVAVILGLRYLYRARRRAEVLTAAGLDDGTRPSENTQANKDTDAPH